MTQLDAIRNVDPARAHLSDTNDFPPFNVEARDERPLGEVLAAGESRPDTDLVFTERRRSDTYGGHETAPLAFVARQLAFHHVAQGEIAGEPWMDSF